MKGYDVTERLEYREVGKNICDDPEKLFRESVREDFSWWRPKKRLLLDPTPWISDLARHRWHRRPFNPDEEIDAVRRLQADRLAHDKLSLTHSVGTRLTDLQRNRFVELRFSTILASRPIWRWVLRLMTLGLTIPPTLLAHADEVIQ